MTKNIFGKVVEKHSPGTSAEWYTPKEYIEAARQVMGSIDCDPASNEIANELVQAGTYYTKETNGYDKPWIGNVWLNPPYGYEGKRCNQERWSQRLIEQYQAGNVKQAVLLVNANTSTHWFNRIWDYPICFPVKRIQFYTILENNYRPTHSSALVYIGPNIDKFHHVFHQFGKIVRAMPNPTAHTLWEELAS